MIVRYWSYEPPLKPGVQSQGIDVWWGGESKPSFQRLYVDIFRIIPSQTKLDRLGQYTFEFAVEVGLREIGAS